MLTEVANNTAFRRACADKAGLCVLVLLDPASADFERHLGEAQTLAGLRAKQPVHFVWVDAAMQPSFAEQFGLQPSDAPAAVALAPKKLRFRVLPGAFSASSLDKLIDAVLAGKERTQGMQARLSSIVLTTPAAGFYMEYSCSISQTMFISGFMAKDIGVQELPELVDGGERRSTDVLEEIEEIDLADLMSETIGGDPNLRTEL